MAGLAQQAGPARPIACSRPGDLLLEATQLGLNSARELREGGGQLALDARERAPDARTRLAGRLPPRRRSPAGLGPSCSHGCFSFSVADRGFASDLPSAEARPVPARRAATGHGICNPGGSGSDAHRCPGRSAGDQEVEGFVGHGKTAVGPVEVGGVAVPALSFAVEAQVAAEGRVRGRRGAALVGGSMRAKSAGSEAALGAGALGVLEGGIVDGEEAVEAAGARGPGDVVETFRGARSPAARFAPGLRPRAIVQPTRPPPMQRASRRRALFVTSIQAMPSQGGAGGLGAGRRRGRRQCGGRCRRQRASDEGSERGEHGGPAEGARIHRPSECRTRAPAAALLVLAGALAAAAPGGFEALPSPLGREETELVAPGDTLLDVAHAHRVGFELLERLNPGVDRWIPKPGSRRAASHADPSAARPAEGPRDQPARDAALRLHAARGARGVSRRDRRRHRPDARRRVSRGGEAHRSGVAGAGVDPPREARAPRRRSAGRATTPSAIAG